MEIHLELADIVLYHGASFSARLIRFVCNSHWNHAAIVVRAQIWPRLVMEADVKGKLREFELEPPSKMAIYRMESLTPAQRYKIVDEALGFKGSVYDFLIVWRIFRRVGLMEGLRILYRMVYKGEDCPVPHFVDEFVVCSELCQEAFSKAGIPLCPDVQLLLPSTIAKLRRTILTQIYGVDVD